MSNRAKKTGPRPNQKPSRAEVGQAFQQAYNDIQNLRVALAWVTDLVIEKGLFTAEELNTFFVARREAAMKAQAEAAAPAQQTLAAAQQEKLAEAPTVVLTD